MQSCGCSLFEQRSRTSRSPDDPCAGAGLVSVGHFPPSPIAVRDEFATPERFRNHKFESTATEASPSHHCICPLVAESVPGPHGLTRSGTESSLTLWWREADSNFQFLGLGRAFYTASASQLLFGELAERVRWIFYSEPLPAARNPLIL